MLGTLDLFLDLRACAEFVRHPDRPRRELVGLGLGNIVSAFVGGVVVAISLSVTTANYRAGGRTRISTIAAALFLSLALLLAPALLSAVPMVVLSALLIIVSIRSFDALTLRIAREALNRRTMVQPPSAPAAIWPSPRRRRRHRVRPADHRRRRRHPAGGLAVHRRYEPPDRAPAADGTSVHSKRVRSRRDLDTLQKGGPLVAVLELQGVLFFGNSDDLATRNPRCRERAIIIILDLRRVSDVDISGATVLHQVAKRCRERNRHLILCGAPPGYARDHAEVVADNDNAFMRDDLDSPRWNGRST